MDVIESGITKLVGADGIRPYAYETIVVTVLGMTQGVTAGFNYGVTTIPRVIYGVVF